MASAIGVAVWMLLGSHALAQDWVVGKVSGKAWMSANGAAPTLLAPGMAVPQGSTISTGPDGRALLVHGQDMVTVGPKSALSVQAGAGAQRTTVLQKSGRITVDVETQNAPHFTVETPFMAAVVKGTRFDVQVSRQGANVNVQRGRVQVADFVTGQTADITPGQRASVRVGGTPGLSLSGKGPMPVVQPGAPRAAVVAPVTGAGAVQAPVAPTAAAPKTSDFGNTGFGPGRSWSNSAAAEVKFGRRPDQTPSSKAGGSSKASEIESVGRVWVSGNGNNGNNGNGNNGNNGNGNGNNG
ncbi:MAG TPA: FecR family protein, partial [Beijerinckiaceae bacterium]|nr:FecR family protein [Beijerinckiaceae bacterium]